MSTTGPPPSAPSPPAPASVAPPPARPQIPPPDDWSEAKKVDKHQNPWAVMIDYIKTVITLATAVLGLNASLQRF